MPNYTAHYARGDYTESLEFEAQNWAEADLIAEYNVPDSEGDWTYVITEVGKDYS